MSAPRAIDRADLINRFAYHAADADKSERHERVRDECFRLAELFVTICPPGREVSLAVTKIEEGLLWANCAIARQGD